MKGKARRREAAGAKQFVEEMEKRHLEDLAESTGCNMDSDGRLRCDNFSDLIKGKKRVMGSAHPRMNLFIMIKANEDEIDDLVSYWKCQSGDVSYFLASECDREFVIGCHAESEADALCEAVKYGRFLVDGKYDLVYPYDRDDQSVDAFDAMQNWYDDQVFYEKDGRIEFWHKVIAVGGSRLLIPVSSELLMPELLNEPKSA